MRRVLYPPFNGCKLRPRPEVGAVCATRRHDKLASGLNFSRVFARGNFFGTPNEGKKKKKWKIAMLAPVSVDTFIVSAAGEARQLFTESARNVGRQGDRGASRGVAAPRG